MKSKKAIGAYAHEYLMQKGYNAVGYGDSHLLHEIAEYAGLPHNAWMTERNILNALERSELFEKRYFKAIRGAARIFYVRKSNLEKKT